MKQLKHKMSEAIGQKIAVCIVHMQRKFAAVCAGLARRCSMRAQKIGFTVFLCLASVWSTYVIVAAICEPSGTSLNIMRDPIRLPVLNKGQSPHRTMISERLLLFQVHVDSLRVHDPPAYQRLQREHPGLLDSLKQLTNTIHSPVNHDYNGHK